MAFPEWLNESDDATFAAELDQGLDITSFADYLAIQDLVNNFDDILGPGNSSCLSDDEAKGLFNVISWDQNLAFGGLGGGTGGRMAGNSGGVLPEGMKLPEGINPAAGFLPPSDMQRPEGMELPKGMELPQGMPTGNGGGSGTGGIGGNVLSQKASGANRQRDRSADPGYLDRNPAGAGHQPCAGGDDRCPVSPPSQRLSPTEPARGATRTTPGLMVHGQARVLRRTAGRSWAARDRPAPPSPPQARPALPSPQRRDLPVAATRKVCPCNHPNLASHLTHEHS